jgi:iron uptake system component EfeO
MMRPTTTRIFGALAAILFTGCSGGTPADDRATKTDSEYENEVLSEMHALLLSHIDALLEGARDIQSSAPAVDRGWDVALDGPALESTRQAWKTARSAYEFVEGAVAPLFPDIDASIDARYDDFLTQLGPTGDTNLFDGEGVTGMHAVERILWADTTPPRVVDFERTLPGYQPAAFPSNAAETEAFRAGLCQKLVDDVQHMRDEWQPVHIHIFVAFQGLVALMNEQREKVRKAASNEEESRYSERTMQDIRDNLAGTREVFALFSPWLRSKPALADVAHDGPTLDGLIEAGFRTLDDAYSAVPGDAMPTPPTTWSSETPTAADLDTPFGHLFSTVSAAVDPNESNSVVATMNAAAKLIGAVIPTK